MTTYLNTFVSTIDQTLPKVDKWVDRSIIGTPFTNLFHLFQKTIIIPCFRRYLIPKSYFYSYLDNKSYFRCITLSFPVLGSIVVMLFDCVKFRVDKAKALAHVQGGLSLMDVSEKFQNNWDVALAAVAQDITAYKHVGTKLKTNKEFVLVVLQTNELDFEHTGEQILNHEQKRIMNSFVYEVLSHNKPAFFEYAKENPINNKYVALAAIRRGLPVFQYLSKELQESDDIQKAADIKPKNNNTPVLLDLESTITEVLNEPNKINTIKLNNPELLDALEFMRPLIEEKSNWIYWIGGDLKKNDGFMFEIILMLKEQWDQLIEDKSTRDLDARRLKSLIKHIITPHKDTPEFMQKVAQVDYTFLQFVNEDSQSMS